MTCNALLIGDTQIEAHVISNVTYARARALAEGCGALVYWDSMAQQTVVVPALAPAWQTLAPLVQASQHWPAEFALHQARVDYAWAQSLRRRIDPRLILAILVQEGTGSLDTNPENSAQYGGNGPDANWIRDTDRAVDLVAGKLCYYYQAIAAGFLTQAETLGLDGNVVQWVNWPGPIYDHNPDWGVYAQDADWWNGVSEAFSEMGGSVRLLSDYWRAGPVAVPQLVLRCQAVTDQPDLCSDTSGTNPRPGVVTRMA